MKRDRMEELQLPEGFRKEIRDLRRGVFLFYSMSLIFVACSVVLFFVGLVLHVWIPLAISVFFISVGCRVILISAGQRHTSAWKIAENPQIVYWGHSTYQTDKPLNESIHLKLHLRDGTELEMAATGIAGIGTTKEQLQ